MNIKVIFFAVLRQLVGLREVELVLPEGSTVQDLKDHLESEHEALQGMMERVAIAVNQEYATPESALSDADEVALLPPVAGGSGIEEQHIQVKETPLDLSEVSDLVQNESGGAIVTFTGIVRRQSKGRVVERLDYEAYGAMAVKEMQKIASEIRKQWPGAEVAIHHRIGSLGVGELAVVIAVCTPHRQEAFDACSYAIERLKERVPIWKHEFFTDGSHWVGWGP